MSDLKEKILKIYPAATFEEGDTLLVNVAEKDWLDVAGALKNDLGFDVLSALVGMDWKETLGVVYYLTSTSRDWKVFSVKVVAESRENPYIHSVVSLWKVANFQEREAYDMFGIKFIGHPDMRRFFLRNDWVGHPFGRHRYGGGCRFRIYPSWYRKTFGRSYLSADTPFHRPYGLHVGSSEPPLSLYVYRESPRYRSAKKGAGHPYNDG